MGGESLRVRLAEKTAEEVLRELGMYSLPVDPFAIADRKGIVVTPKPTSKPGVSGFLMKAGDDFGISYATHVDVEGYQRFTVAHELGHYFLDGHAEKLFGGGNGTHPSRSAFHSDDPLEQEADYFAASLLMPRELFRAAMRGAGEGFGAVKELATCCRTSLTATAIRYARTTDDAFAVVMSEGAFVHSCFMSEEFAELVGPRRLPKGTLLPKDTRTYHFNRDLENIRECRTAEDSTVLAAWFGRGRGVPLKEDVAGLGGYGRTMTLLFADESD